MDRTEIRSTKARNLQLTGTFDRWMADRVIFTDSVETGPRAWELFSNYMEWARENGEPHDMIRKITPTSFGLVLKFMGFTKIRRANGWVYPGFKLRE